MDEVYLTPQGFAKLKEEYRFLTEERRARVAGRIKAARELGDISENAEYDSAREEQSFVEGRIAELRKILSSAKVGGAEKNPSPAQVVKLGSHVRVALEGREEVYLLVGAEEADPSRQKISHESPLGRALLGKKVGEKVEVEAPAGKIGYLILEVKT